MNALGLFLFGLLSFSNADLQLQAKPPLRPNPEWTMGDLCHEDDPDFAGFRYRERIPYCTRNVSQHQKRRIYELYEIPSECWSDYTIDHFIPLALGGSNRPENLWPEHVLIKAQRRDLEFNLYLQLAHGKITQQEAVDAVIEAKMNPPRIKLPECHSER